MNTLLLTGWDGTEYALVACETIPMLHEYSQRHGYDFACECMNGSRAPAWQKIPLIREALNSYDRVIWIDADVVIEQGDVDILDECPRAIWQALVRHRTECGEVPNTGVWILSKAMLPILEQAWRLEKYINHGWWEQAAILELMGYDLSAKSTTAKRDKPTPAYENTFFLDATWNHHPQDVARVDTPRFRHVTQYPDRLAAVRECVKSNKRNCHETPPNPNSTFVASASQTKLR